jgi:hypothetical protein
MHSHSRTLLAKLGFGDVDRKSPRHDLACNYLALRNDVLIATIQSALPKPLRVEGAAAQLECPIQKGTGQYATTIGWVDVLANARIGFPVPMASPVQTADDRRELAILDLQKKSEWANFDPSEADRTGAFLAWRTAAEASLGELSTDDLLRESELGSRLLKESEAHTGSSSVIQTIIIEVKIGPVGVGDLIRQLRLYNQYVERKSTKPVFRTNAPGWEGKCGYDVTRRWNCNRAYFERKSESTSDALKAALRQITIAVCDFEMDAEYTKALRSAGIHPVRLGKGFEEFLKQRAESVETTEVTTI